MATERRPTEQRRASEKQDGNGDDHSGAPRGVVGRNVGAVRDRVIRSVLAPLNAVLLSRRHIEEVVDDAVKRGRMTREDAQALVQSLLQRGAKQTDDFLADLERLLARSGFEERSSKPARSRSSRRSRPRRSVSNLAVDGYDDLSAAQVQDRLEGLTAAELRKLRDYERRHANRKTVLDRIERKLR
jgi:polyhydroxyalkanoate synthesis regulator phasin